MSRLALNLVFGLVQLLLSHHSTIGSTLWCNSVLAILRNYAIFCTHLRMTRPWLNSWITYICHSININSDQSISAQELVGIKKNAKSRSRQAWHNDVQKGGKTSKSNFLVDLQCFGMYLRVRSRQPLPLQAVGEAGSTFCQCFTTPLIVHAKWYRRWWEGCVSATPPNPSSLLATDLYVIMLGYVRRCINFSPFLLLHTLRQCQIGNTMPICNNLQRNTITLLHIQCCFGTK